MDKNHILQEIRRTAKENGGAPLGRQRFFQETGIRETDWSGRYWSRWSDAVREAGFLPNSLQTAFDEDDLIEHYITLVRKLGRIPTNAELQIERRADPTFPSHNTFARFGTKSELISKIRGYSQAREGYDDIVSLCDSYGPLSRRSDASRPTATAENIGFVYLMKSGRFYKIGKTNAAGRRERELAIQLPQRASTVHVIRTDDPSGIEAYWHKRFADRRKNGEWFELSAADVTVFKRRKFM